MGLQRYFEKRNFRDTPEPRGREHGPKKKALSFVIQKHDATRLHYDFRLELGGVLVSWAVPKGIPAIKGDKRLAMHVEDHPLEYGGFEGIIPEGNYGAGTVMLWDHGTWEILEGDPAQALNKGKLHFRLEGKKLKGEWTLVRMRGREELGKEPWLLIKSGENMKPIATSADDESVKSGRSMEQIATGRSKVWHSNREASSKKAGKTTRSQATPKGRSNAKTSTPQTRRNGSSELLTEVEKFPKEMPAYAEPMKALLVDKAPKEEGWLYKIKWDGYRCLAVKKGETVRLFSRRARDISSEYPEIVEAVKAMAVDNAVLDGEIVAVDAQGHASFQLLQNCKQRRLGGDCRGLLFYIFDLPNLEGHNLKRAPLAERKQILEKLLHDVPPPIRYSATFDGDPEALLEEARKNRIEGLVGKRADSIYEPGRRSPAWIKLKISLEQEFVIGGYTEPKGSRDHFGSVLAGYYQGDELMYAARVGTGFDQRLLKELYTQFQKLSSPRCPFANVPTPSRGWSQGLTRAEMKRCTWLEPKLVCQVRFSEWTEDGGLRHPSFLGLRDDKPPREVTREIPQNLRSSVKATRSSLR